MLAAVSERLVAEYGISCGTATRSDCADIGRKVPAAFQIGAGDDIGTQNFTVAQGNVMDEPYTESQQKGWDENSQILPVGFEILEYAPEKFLQVQFPPSNGYFDAASDSEKSP